MKDPRKAVFVGGAAQNVVGGYDAARDRWGFSFDSPFWHAVRHAHELGHRGAGRRVAIVDSGCDLTIPRLRQRVDSAVTLVATPADKDTLGHGTAVALLVSEVAPECRIDVYQVERDGRPDIEAAIEALHRVAASSADAVNVSIAVTAPFQFTAQQLAAALQEGDGSGRKHAYEESPCGLCAAASAASAKGKLVFAAVGNQADTASCPARARGVAAVGFSSEETTVVNLPSGGKQSAVFAAGPGSPQSLLADLSLKEIPGMLGSSFASPLFAAAGTLGVSQEELRGHIDANAAAAFPQLFMGLIRDGTVKAVPDLVKQVSQWFVSAQAKLPHVHCDYQATLNPRVAASDPAACFQCGIFSEPVLVNHGLWLLETSRTQDARSLLEAIRAAAPWSADATANLGAALREAGDIPGAIKLYERALLLRPGFKVYTSELKRLRKRMPGGASWWSRLWN